MFIIIVVKIYGSKFMKTDSLQKYCTLNVLKSFIIENIKKI